MEWDKLLSLKKYQTRQRLRSNEDEKRVSFEIDYDRIVFSSEFRSLQDKTQVIPLSQTGFVHTRLTHSMEVSVVGRSIGRAAGQIILQRHPLLVRDQYTLHDFGYIVASAALAHDIGNPPFGHGGEKAIGDFFATSSGQIFKDLLTPKQYQDLRDFEGNANGFRILTQVREGINGGFRLNYATLGAFTKYPKESLPKKPTDHIWDKKYGFFQSEKKNFKDVADHLGLIKTSNHSDDISYARHPLAFLVEASDDICYSIIDFEDGVNLDIISEEEATECLMPLVKNKIIHKNFKALPYKRDRISYLRALAIGNLIEEATATFVDCEKDILNGKYTKSLMDDSQYKVPYEHILDISRQRIYKSMEVIEKEIVGYKMLHTLLDAFIMAYYRNYQGIPTSYDNLILSLLPDRYLTTDDIYLSLIHITSFISELSDGRIVNLYNKLSKIGG